LPLNAGTIGGAKTRGGRFEDVARRTERLLRRLLKVSITLVISSLLTGCNIGCWFVPCDLSLDVTVRVTDPSGTPLSGVHVVVLGRAGDTDKNGCVELESVIDAHELDLRATATGYKPLDQKKPYGFYDIDVVLEPATSARPSSGTWKTQRTQRCAT
jgi:hypothetical protein